MVIFIPKLLKPQGMSTVLLIQMYIIYKMFWY
jgi:hypothetical protein